MIVAGVHNPRDGQLPLIGQASDDLGILPGPGERGSKVTARMATLAITTSSSTKVKPDFRASTSSAASSRLGSLR